MNRQDAHVPDRTCWLKIDHKSCTFRFPWYKKVECINGWIRGSGVVYFLRLAGKASRHAGVWLPACILSGGEDWGGPDVVEVRRPFKRLARMRMHGERVEFDAEQLAHSLEDDQELLRELLQAYVEDAPVRLAALTSSVEQQDPEGVVSAAHSLKGMSGVIRVTGLEKQALELEMAARDRDMDRVGRLYEMFRENLERVLTQARAYLR